MYISITDGFVVSKDCKLHTIPASTMRTSLSQTVFIYDDSSHVTCDLTFPSKKKIIIRYGQRW